ncbi:hypothetical protein FSP39_022746 [Pinctada imbricata]|uniref:Small integral membrane protein 15 n=1 Tax=Pinctada imbricata TaxID=66713 RepID=A0AA88XTX8_PINIB|nr:hypothetical protein FSP39_022746 [Pinctada imbricata]
MTSWDWREILESTLKWAATDPWQFIYYVLLCLSPLFLISAILAWNLAKQIEAKEKEQKRKARREANIKKANSKKSKKED